MISNNKYNPDVLISYNKVSISNKNTKYEIKNQPYNIIIDDKNVMKDSKNFSINCEKQDNIMDKYYILNNERNANNNKKLSKKNVEEIKNKFKLKNTEMVNINNENLPNDFNDIKHEFQSDFLKEEESLRVDREKYNNILDSLLEEGLLD